MLQHYRADQTNSETGVNGEKKENKRSSDNMTLAGAMYLSNCFFVNSLFYALLYKRGVTMFESFMPYIALAPAKIAISMKGSIMTTVI